MKIEKMEAIGNIIAVLERCNLPVSDITSTSHPTFFGISISNAVVAVVGLEIFGTVGLLRSLAVIPPYQKQRLGGQLVTFVENHARTHGVDTLFLLTTTAEDYFSRRGYENASRQDAPAEIKSTAQFSGLCPSSSAFLSKKLNSLP